MNEPLEALPPEASPYPFWTWEDVLIFFGLGLPSLVASVAVVALLGWAFGLARESAVTAILGQLVSYGLWFGGLVMIFRTRYDAPFWRSLAWFWPREGMMSSIVQGPMLAFAVGWLGVALQTPVIDAPFNKLMSDPASIALIGVFASTLGPVCEELAFRGFLMPLLIRAAGVWGGILLAAVPFALLHGPQYAWSWRHILLLTLAGAAFGRVRHVTGSTAAAAVTHCAYNLTLFSAFLATQTKG